MNDFSAGDALRQVIEGLGAALAAFVPRALTALVVLVLGLLAAGLARRLVRGAFARLRLDDLLERAGLTDLLRRIGLEDSPGEVLARTSYWLLVLLFAQAAAQAVGLDTVGAAIGAFFAYLPNLLAAVVVLLIGVLVGRFAGTLVARAAADAGVEFAPALGRTVTALVVFVVTVMAVAQLRIDTDLIKAVVLVLLSGAALALALSFGLGTREVTRHLVAGFYLRKLWQVGDEVTLDGETGTVAGITPLQTLLERDGRVTVVPNALFLEKVSRARAGAGGEPAGREPGNRGPGSA